MLDRKVKRVRKKKKNGQRPEAVAPTPSVEVETLLTKFADVFPAELPKGLPPPRPTDTSSCSCRTALLPQHCLYRVPLTQKAELKRQIDELLAAGHVERAQSQFNTKILFIKKNDKPLRICVDHRRLNAITVKDVYPTPRVDVSVDKMKGAMFFA